MANPPHVVGSIPDQNMKPVMAQQGTPDMTPQESPQPTSIVSEERLGITPGGRTVQQRTRSRKVMRMRGLDSPLLSEKNYTPN